MNNLIGYPVADGLHYGRLMAASSIQQPYQVSWVPMLVPSGSSIPPMQYPGLPVDPMTPQIASSAGLLGYENQYLNPLSGMYHPIQTQQLLQQSYSRSHPLMYNSDQLGLYQRSPYSYSQSVCMTDQTGSMYLASQQAISGMDGARTNFNAASTTQGFPPYLKLQAQHAAEPAYRQSSDTEFQNRIGNTERQSNHSDSKHSETVNSNSGRLFRPYISETDERDRLTTAAPTKEIGTQHQQDHFGSIGFGHSSEQPFRSSDSERLTQHSRQTTKDVIEDSKQNSTEDGNNIPTVLQNDTANSSPLLPSENSNEPTADILESTIEPYDVCPPAVAPEYLHRHYKYLNQAMRSKRQQANSRVAPPSESEDADLDANKTVDVLGMSSNEMDSGSEQEVDVFDDENGQAVHMKQTVPENAEDCEQFETETRDDFSIKSQNSSVSSKGEDEKNIAKVDSPIKSFKISVPNDFRRNSKLNHKKELVEIFCPTVSRKKHRPVTTTRSGRQVKNVSKSFSRKNSTDSTESEESQSLRHQKVPKGSFACSMCKKIYPYFSQLRLHEARHERRSCTHCNKEFRDTVQLQNHYASVHGEKAWTPSDTPEVKRRKHDCGICKQHFKNAVELQKHRAIHDTQGKYDCSKCGKTFWYWQTRKSHVRLCSSLKNEETSTSRLSLSSSSLSSVSPSPPPLASEISFVKPEQPTLPE